MTAAPAIDVHQHLWSPPLIEALRSRREAPFLRGWTLHVSGEPAYDVRPHDHDVVARVARDRAAGVGTACVGLSSPLGIEELPPDEAAPLLETWHDSIEALPCHFRGWAAAPTREHDPATVAATLQRERIVGLQVPATMLASPLAWQQAAPLLALAEAADKPVLVHPGPARSPQGSTPGWWAPTVDYVAQQQAAWWGWRAGEGRTLLPGLRLIFAAGAGLAPLHHERQVLRGGLDAPLDPLVHVDSAGYGPRAHDALVRALGIDALVLGSDRPYGEPLARSFAGLFGDAASHAVRVTNPARALGAGLTRPQGALAWTRAS